MELHGCERISLEFEGRIERPTIPALAAGLPLVQDERGVEVGILYFQMEGLRPGALPWPALRYRELLWRVGVLLEGEPAWLAMACELDSSLVAALARRSIRYPVHAAILDDSAASDETIDMKVSSGGESLVLRATPGDEQPVPRPPRRTLVRADGRLWEVPWRETPAPDRRQVLIDVRDDALATTRLGAPVSWAPHGLLHHGRIHHCGVARKL